METITIRKYKTEDQNEVISLIVDSFESKFLYKQALSKGALKEILVNI